VTARVFVPALVVVVSLVALGAASGAVSVSDEELARAGVLVVSDFPAGWTASARATTSDAVLDAAAAKVASCRPFVAFSRANKKNPRAKSPNIELQHSNVTNAVSVYPSAARAAAAMRTFADPRLPDCLERLFRAVFARQLKSNEQVADQVESITTSIAPVPDVRVGDEAVGYQGTVDVGLRDGTTQTIGLGVVSARVGSAVTGFSWTADSDIAPALQPAIVKSVSRLQDAQSGR